MHGQFAYKGEQPHRSRISQPSPAIVVAVLALVAALAGTAIAGPDASTSALSKKKVKQLIEKEVAEQIANATGPPGTPGADGAHGAAGADGADGTARAYARIIPHTTTPCTGGVGANECTFDRSKGRRHRSAGRTPASTASRSRDNSRQRPRRGDG